MLTHGTLSCAPAKELTNSPSPFQLISNFSSLLLMCPSPLDKTTLGWHRLLTRVMVPIILIGHETKDKLRSSGKGHLTF